MAAALGSLSESLIFLSQNRTLGTLFASEFARFRVCATMRLSMGRKAKRYSAGIAATTFVFVCQLVAQPLNPKDPKTVFERGQRELSHGQYRQAEQDFDRLIRAGIRTAPVYTNLGVVYLRTGRLDAAVKVLTQAAKLAPSVPGIRLNLGLAYFKQREFKKAAAQFENVVSADPANAQARYLSGTCHFMTDNFAAAVADFEPITNREPGDLEYLYMLGVSYGMVKRPDDAGTVFERLVTAGRDTPHLHLLLGKAYLALGQSDKAKAEFTHATAGESLPYAHYYLGVLFQKLGRIEEAASQFEREIEIAPNNSWAYKDLSEIKLDQGDTTGAIALLQTATQRNPHAPELFDVLGRSYLRTNDFAKAIPVLQRAIALDDKNGSYHAQLSRALNGAGQRRQAENEMARARALMIRPPDGAMEVLSRDRRDSSRTIKNQ
jgi:tetratricopeptide (TPR) repeat protein